MKKYKSKERNERTPEFPLNRRHTAMVGREGQFEIRTRKGEARGQDSDILNEELREALGDYKTMKNLLQTGKGLEDWGEKGIGISDWRTHSTRNPPKPSRPSKPALSPPVSTALQSRQASQRTTLNLLFSSVKHLISPMSPLQSSPIIKEKAKIPKLSDSSKAQKKPPLKTPDPLEDTVQYPDVSTTVSVKNPLWVKAGLSKLAALKGLDNKLSQQLSWKLRNRKRKAEPASPHKPTKQAANPPYHPLHPTASVKSKMVSPRTASPTPSNINSRLTPSPIKKSKSFQLKKTESPVKPDSTIQTTMPEPDSSSQLTNLKPYTRYYDDGNKHKHQGEEMERSYAYILAMLKYTEAVHHFNMAAYVLEQDLEALIARRDKASREEIYKKAANITDVILNRNMDLCYKIRTFYNDDSKRRRLSEEELEVLDRLMIVCFRSEAKLNLILFKANTAFKETELVQMVKKNESLLTQIDQNAQVDRRQSPDSPMTCRPREDHVTLSKDNWKAIKTHCRTGNYIMKAHMKWQQAERLHRQQNHEDFFARIPRICEVPQLKFYESSLKDLSMYQKAVVNELRDQIQSNHDP